MAAGEGTPDLLVIIPAFNEGQSVAEVVGRVRAALPGADVLVVDDGSVDDTSDAARSAGATVARLPYNFGVGGAMRLGYRYANEHGYRRAIQIDADGQHDPAQAETLLAALANANLVIGARFAGAGEYVVKGPRRWAMVVLARVLSRVTGTKLTDTTSGFRASDRSTIELFARHYPVEYLGDTVETLVLAARADLKIAQVPVVMGPRIGGIPSQSPVKAALYLGRALMALCFALVRR